MYNGKKALELYYLHQPYAKSLKDYTHFSGLRHPSCGDAMSVWIFIEDNKLVSIGYEIKGCMLSQAVSSLLASLFIDQTSMFVTSMSNDELSQRLGITLGPVRFKCALLALQAFQQACNNPV